MLKYILVLLCFIPEFQAQLTPKYGPECPDNWLPQPGSSNCFRFYDHIQLSWEEADRYCNASGATLARIHDAKTSTFLEDYGTRFLYYHIGLHRTNSRTEDWVWSDGQGFNSDSDGIDWGDKKDSKDNCAMISADPSHYVTEKLYHVPCSGYETNFICQRNASDPLFCPKDWTHIGDNCYKLRDDQRNFYSADDQCAQDGGQLLAVTKPEISQFLVDAMHYEGATSAWIGLAADDGNFTWLGSGENGTGVDPKDYWGVGEPGDKTDLGQCAQVWSSDNAWHSVSCNLSTSYFCSRPQGACQNGWQEFGGNCYQFDIYNWVQWTVARDTCSGQNAIMLHIDSEEEDRYVSSTIDQYSYYWMGFTDAADLCHKTTKADDKTLQWCDNHKNVDDGYTNFVYKEHEDGTADQNCGVLYGPKAGQPDGEWRLEDCNSFYNWFACQAPVGHPVTSLNNDFEDYSCDFGWNNNGKYCFYFANEKLPWADADAACQKMQSWLITVDSSATQSYADTHFEATNDYWIGLKGSGTIFQWHTAGGKTVALSDYTRWKDQKVPTPKADACVATEMFFDGHGVKFGQWIVPDTGSDSSCTAAYEYVCQKDAYSRDSPPGTTLPPMTWFPQCGPYWKYEPVSGYCYRVSNDISTWEEAESTCVHYGGHLVSIHDQAESATITAYLAEMGERSLWIGANDLDRYSAWQWSDGTAFNYIHWVDGQPDSYMFNEHCVEMFGTVEQEWFGRWNDLDCNERRPFLCKKWSDTKTTVVTQFTTPPTRYPNEVWGCEPGWSDYGSNYCYMLSTDHATRDDAMTKCRQLGGDLASVHSDAENLALLAIASNKGFLKDRSWIGLSDIRVTDLYEWSDGTVTDATFWNAGEPNGHSAEPCVEFYDDNGHWNDINCQEQLTYFCKKEKSMQTSVAPTGSDGCPPGMVGYLQKCYFFDYSQKVNDTHAADLCNQRGGYLVHIDDESEQAFITAEMTTHQPNDELAWFGLEMHAFSWQWRDDESKPSYTRWQEGNPNWLRGTCAALNTQGEFIGDWVSTTCSSSSHPFVCELPRIGTQYTTTVPTTLPHFTFKQDCADPTWHRMLGGDGGGSRCIKAFSDQGGRTWDEARTYCENINAYGKLLSIPSVDVNNFIMSDIFQSWDSQSYWIGLNSFDGTEQWSDGSPVIYTNWGSDPATGHQDDHCVMLTPSSGGKWYVANCGLTYSWLCEVPINHMLSTLPPTTPPSQPKECLDMDHPAENPWMYFVDVTPPRCFWVSGSGVDDLQGWQEANDMCNKRFNKAANLATIHDNVTQLAITTLLQKRNFYYNGYWIGLSRLTASDRSLRWVDTTPLDYTYWEDGEPNDAGMLGESCVEAYKHGKWNDRHCATAQPYICEYYTYGTSPAPPTTESPIVDWDKAFCPLGWVKGERKCFKFFQDNAISFPEATKSCRNLAKDPQYANPVNHPDLASILSDYDQLAILLGGADLPQNTFYYIGLSSDLQPWGQWGWTDNNKMDYQNWAENEPSGYYDENCGVIDISENNHAGKWFDFQCDSHANTAGYVCQMDLWTEGTRPMEYSKCDTGFSLVRKSCFKDTLPVHDTWQMLEDNCTGIGAGNTHLASINNVYEETFLRKKMIDDSHFHLDDKSFWWIGFKDNTKQNVYQWSDGWPVLYTNWAPDQPQPVTISDMSCVAIDQMTGYWHQKDCTSTDNQYSGFCKYSLEKPPQPPTHCLDDDGQLVCPPSTPDVQWWDSGNADGVTSCDCYSVSRNQLTQLEAHRECIQAEGDLVSIHSDRENDWIVANILKKISTPNTPGGDSPWIGLIETYTGGFTWTDGTGVYYDHWNDGEPNHYDSSEECVEMLNGKDDKVKGKWNDITCNAVRPYICKTPKRQAPRTPKPTIDTTTCDGSKEWFKYDGSCYYVSAVDYSNSVLSWRKAQANCKRMGGNLASIHDVNELNYVVALVEYQSWYSYTVWIGLSELQLDGTYRWSDESILDYENWADGEPNDYNGYESCVEMYSSSDGKWNDQRCDVEMEYVCKMPDSSVSTPSPTPYKPVTGGCQDGWQTSPAVDYCYKLVGESPADRKRWQEADDDCRQMGKMYGRRSRLASVHSQIEQYWLMAMQTEYEAFHVWIGLNDVSWYGQFKWSDESVVNYVNWDYGEPKPTYNDDYCVHLYYPQGNAANIGRWQVAWCNYAFAYICQMDKDPTITATPLPPIQFNCNGGYLNHMNGGACYYVKTEAAVWDNAEKECQKMSENTHLVSILDPYEQALISVALATELSNSKDEGVWIGMKKIVSDKEESFTWVDGWPIVYTNWDENSPSNNPMSDRIRFNLANYKWEDWAGQREMKYVCKTSTVQPPTKPTDFPGICPGSDPRYPFLDSGTDGCFQFVFDQSVSFADAQLSCMQQGAELASFHYDEELQFLRGRLQAQGNGPDLWIGLFRDNDGSWRWTDGSPVDLTDWSSAPTGDNQCAKIQFDSNYYPYWYTEKCTLSMGYVCRAPKYLPSTYPSTTGVTLTNPFKPHTPGPREDNKLINPLIDMPGLTFSGVVLIVLTGLIAIGVVYLYIQSRKATGEEETGKDTGNDNNMFREEI